MSRKKKALVLQLHGAIDDWHILMEDARGDREEASRTRRDINRTREALRNLKRRNIDATCEKECGMF